MDTEITSFEKWYADHYGSVLAVLSMYCTGDYVQAEDATNDGFVAAFAEWETVSQMQAPSAWVARVAINSANRRFQRRKRRIELLNSQRIEVTAVDQQRDLDVMEALAELPKRQRTALVLRYVEDLSQAGVAEHMNIALGTATATLTQARQRLRKNLEESETA